VDDARSLGRLVGGARTVGERDGGGLGKWG